MLLGTNRANGDKRIIYQSDENWQVNLAKQEEKFDVIISGAGLIGLTIANALAIIEREDKLKIALISPKISQIDGRTTALLTQSVEYLQEIGVWKSASPNAAKMSMMRIVDNTKRAIHAPEIAFKSVEISLDAFGYNILNTDLSAALLSSVAKHKHLQKIDDKIASLVPCFSNADTKNDHENLSSDNDGVQVNLQSGKKLFTKLIIGADGRNSTVRKYADDGKSISVRQWNYPQTAIVLNFSHTLPHNDTSTEFHNISGPFTVVPLKEGISSLVWVSTAQAAAEIMATDRKILDREIEDQMHSILGKTKIITELKSFPLSGMNAKKMAYGRFFLVGEAGHVFPPIGAQGYNLGVRDVKELAALLPKLIDKPDDLAKRYNSARRRDVVTRTISVDLFNRSLLNGFLPLQALRAGAITALDEIGSIRRFMMREGVSPGEGVRNITKRITDFGANIKSV